MNNLPFSLKILLILTFSGWNMPVINAQRVEKFLGKLDGAFLVGESSEINRIHDKLISITEDKELSLQDSVRLLYAESRFQRWSGNYKTSESLAKKYLQMIRKRLGEKSDFYRDFLLRRAVVSNEAGDHTTCRDVLSDFFELNRKFPVSDSEMVFNARFLQTRNAIEMGNLGEAAGLIEKLVFKAENRLSEYHEFEGKFEELSKKQLERRHHELLMARVLRARFLRERGDLADAGKELGELEKFRKKYRIRLEDQANIEYWFEKARYKFEVHERPEAILLLRNALTWFSRREGYAYTYFKTHEQYLHMLETLVAFYLEEQDLARALDYEKAIHRVMRKRFPKASVYAVRAEIPQGIQWDIQDDSLVKNLAPVLNNVVLHKLPVRYSAKIFEFLRNAWTYRDSIRRAESLFKREIQFLDSRVGSASVKYHATRCELAGFYARQGIKLDTAETLFRESLHGVLSSQMAESSMLVLNAWNREGLIFEYRNQFQKALSNYQYVLQVMERGFGKESFEVAVQQIRVAEMEMNLGEYASAEKKLLASLKMIRRKNLENRLERSECERLLAKLYITTGRFLEADRYLGLSLRRRSGMADGDVFRFNGMDDEVVLLLQKGLFLEAQEKTDQIIERRTRFFQNSDHRSLILPYQLSAQVYTSLGQYAKAEAMGLKACDAGKVVFGDTSLQYFKSQSVLARVYASFGDYDRALERAQRSYAGISRFYGDQHVEAAAPLTDIAMVLLHKGADKKEVLLYLNKAAEIIKARFGDKNPKYAEALQYLASFFLHSKMFQDAQPLLDQADEIWKEQLGKKNVHSAEILIMQSDIDANLGHVEKSRDALEKAAGIYKEIFSDIHPRYLEILPRISQSYYIQDKQDKAISFAREACRQNLLFIRQFFPSMSEREKSRMWNSMRVGFEYFYSVVLRWNHEEPELIGDMYDNILKTKAILLSSSIQVRERILSSENEDLKLKYMAWIRKKEEVNAAVEMAPEERKLAGKDLRKLESEADELEASLSKMSEEFSKSRKENTARWENIREALKPGERAVEMTRFRYFGKSLTDSVIYAALILDPLNKKGPKLHVFPNGNKMETSFARYYRKSVRLGLQDTLSYSVFWKPLKPYLLEGSNVYFSPDGVYNEVNPEGFLRPDGKFIIESEKIVTLASTRDLLQRTTNKSGKSESNLAMIVGNPHYYPGGLDTSDKRKIDHLPGTGLEVEKITKVLSDNKWQVHVVLGEKANEDTLKRVRTPRLLHIATHGYFKETPKAFFVESAYSILNRNVSVDNPLLRSGLYLSDAGKVLDRIDDHVDSHVGDGIFSSLEAMNLHLANTELVVLSACETGRGDVQVGEGVYGLHRSFQIAGSGAVIMSLFKVSDEATQELMSLFYQNWINNKQKIRTAFTSAKIELKKKYPQPIYWASFVLVGGE